MRLASEKRNRRSYIGGHDASAILGLNPYRNASDVYARIVCGHETTVTPRMRRGLIVEPGMMDHAADTQGVAIDRDAFFLDDRIRFFGGSVDGVENPFHRPRVLHEAKSTLAHGFGAELADRWGPAGSDDVERTCWLQCQWYMGITGAAVTHVWLLVLDEDEDPRHYVVPRNPTSIKELRDSAEAFWWDHVVPQVPPAMAPKTEGAARTMWPKGVKDLAQAPTPELITAAQVFAFARQAEKEAKTTKDAAGAVLRTIMGSAEKAKFPGGSVSLKEMQLDPKTDWEQVAHQLALKFQIPGEVFIGLVREETRKPYTGSRVLRVTMTQPKKEK